MRNGRTFPYRPRRVDPCGDGEGQARGVLDAPVKAGREQRREVRAALIPRRETKRQARRRRTHAPKKNRAGELRWRPYQNRLRWAGRAYRGDRGNRGQGTRHNGPATSGEGVPPRT